MPPSSNAMFAPSDMPKGWAVVTEESITERGDELCAILGIDPGPVHGWGVLERSDNGLRALVLLRGNPGDQGGRASAVAFWSRDGRPVTGADLRSLPLAELEQRFSQRRIVDHAWVASALQAWPSWSPDTPIDPKAPLGSRADASAFYSRVALQWIAFADTEPHPTANIAEVNEVSLRTAQQWVTKAREMGLLPAGRRGRAK